MGFTNNYQVKIEGGDTQQTLLHRVATPLNPPVTAKDLISNPGLRAICTGQAVTVTNPGNETTYVPDGMVTVKKPGGIETTHNTDGTKFIKKSDSSGVATIESYTADNKLTSIIKTDPDGMKVQSTSSCPEPRPEQVKRLLTLLTVNQYKKTILIPTVANVWVILNIFLVRISRTMCRRSKLAGLVSAVQKKRETYIQNIRQTAAEQKWIGDGNDSIQTIYDSNGKRVSTTIKDNRDNVLDNY